MALNRFAKYVIWAGRYPAPIDFVEQHPNGSLHVDFIGSDHDWLKFGEAYTLTASLKAIERGVEYFNGDPALPHPLRALLTDTCAHCGHAVVQWPGPLAPLEEEVEKAEATIAMGPAGLASLRASVQPYLAEPVTS